MSAPIDAAAGFFRELFAAEADWFSSLLVECGFGDVDEDQLDEDQLDEEAAEEIASLPTLEQATAQLVALCSSELGAYLARGDERVRRELNDGSIDEDYLGVCRPLLLLQEVQRAGERLYVAVAGRALTYDTDHLDTLWVARCGERWEAIARYHFAGATDPRDSEARRMAAGFWVHEGGEEIGDHPSIRTRKVHPPDAAAERAAFFRVPLLDVPQTEIDDARREIDGYISGEGSLTSFRRICAELISLPEHEVARLIPSLAGQLDEWVDEQVEVTGLDPEHPAWPLTKVLELDLEERPLQPQVLDALPGLRRLALKNASHDDLRAVCRISRLPHLELRWCFQIGTLAPLFEHPSLRRLTIVGRGTLDLRAAPWLPPRVRTLELRNLDLETLEVLRGARGLEQLRVYEPSNTFHRVSSVPGLEGLRELDLSYSHLRSLEGIAELTRLEVLNLGTGRFDSLAGLERLERLEHLDLSGCENLRSVPEVGAMRSLTYLNLTAATPIEDIAPLSGCCSLKWLGLAGQQLRSLDPLAEVTSLETLAISYCPALVSADVLSPLTNLRRIIFSHCNNLVDVRALDALPRLEHLFIEQCSKVPSTKRGSRYDRVRHTWSIT